MNALKKYGQTTKETASRERLLVLLFEAALRHMRNGASALESGRAADAVLPISKANDIVVELQATLDTARAPELCQQLGAVYQFVAQRLLLGSLKKDAKLVREAERAFLPLVEAFQQAVQVAAGAPVRVAP